MHKLLLHVIRMRHACITRAHTMLLPPRPHAHFLERGRLPLRPPRGLPRRIFSDGISRNDFFEEIPYEKIRPRNPGRALSRFSQIVEIFADCQAFHSLSRFSQIVQIFEIFANCRNFRRLSRFSHDSHDRRIQV